MKRILRRKWASVTGKYYRKFYASLAAPGKLKKNYILSLASARYTLC